MSHTLQDTLRPTNAVIRPIHIYEELESICKHMVHCRSGHDKLILFAFWIEIINLSQRQINSPSGMTLCSYISPRISNSLVTK